MIQTPNIGLDKYELTDAANLADGYNHSMDILDKACAEMMARFPIQTDDIADRAVTSSKLNNGSVTTDKIVDANVTNSKLASKAITIDKISDEALKNISDNVITSLDNGNITNSMLADDSVTSDKLAINSVTSDKLAINSVTSDKLATNSVTTNSIANGSITSDKLAINSVTTSSIANGSITSDKLADNITFQPTFMPKRGDVSVCFGDSNATGYMLNNPSTENFYYQICQQLGLEYHNYSVGASGFALENNILAQVKTAAADTTINKDSVKFVILLAGRNDYFNSAFSAAQIAPGIREVINTIYTTFPNAIIFAGDMDWSYYYPTLADMEEMRKIRAAYLSTEAPVVVVPTWHVGLDASMNTYYNNIDHYNLKAHTILAKTFISKMFFGTTYVERPIINSGCNILNKDVITVIYGNLISTINPDALTIVNTGTLLVQFTTAAFPSSGTDPVMDFDWAKINANVTFYMQGVLMQNGNNYTIHCGTTFKSNVIGNIKTNKPNYSTTKTSFTLGGKPETPTISWCQFIIP